VVQRKREVFLNELILELQPLYPQLKPHFRIEWQHPKSEWPGPEADILIDTPSRRFIIEDDNDCDPGRSIIKYWPILDADTKISLTIIGIWERGHTTGEGYGKLAEWVGTKLMELYSPRFVYRFIERKDESAKSITEKVAQIITSYLGNNGI
jgi:hypothetical protein